MCDPSVLGGLIECEGCAHYCGPLWTAGIHKLPHVIMDAMLMRPPYLFLLYGCGPGFRVTAQPLCVTSKKVYPEKVEHDESYHMGKKPSDNRIFCPLHKHIHRADEGSRPVTFWTEGVRNALGPLRIWRKVGSIPNH